MTNARRAPPPVAFWVAVAVIALLAVGASVLVDAPERDVSSVGVPSTGPPSPPPSSPGSGLAAGGDPSPSATPPPRGSLVIHGTGDVNLDPNYISTFATHGYGYAWSGLGGLFRRDDLTVVNLECAVSDRGAAVPKEFNFRGDPDALPAMRDAGVEVANLGNNHSYDFGPQALVDTVRNVERAGMEPVGAGANRREALAPALFDLEGWRVAVVGLDQVVDPFPQAVATATEPGTAAGHDTGLMIEAIRAAADRAEIVVVMIHWGVELDIRPRAEQVALGRRMIEAGADVIFGGHSHRLQPMDTYRNRPIFYSLGNFVWPDLSHDGSVTAVAEVRVSPRGDVRGRLLPAFISAPGHPVLR